MTENSVKITAYLKANYGKEVSKQKVADDTGVSLAAVTMFANVNAKKGYLTERLEEEIVDPGTETRKAKVKVIRYIQLTEAGLMYDQAADEADREAAKEATKAALKAEREAAKAAKALEPKEAKGRTRKTTTPDAE